MHARCRFRCEENERIFRFTIAISYPGTMSSSKKRKASGDVNFETPKRWNRRPPGYFDPGTKGSSYKWRSDVQREFVRNSPSSEVTKLPTAPSNSSERMVIIDPQELVGRTFLMDTCDGGQCVRARIVEYIQEHEKDRNQADSHVQFRISVNDNEYEDIIAYNELMDYIQKNSENDQIVWRFKRIVGHQGPLKPSDPFYKGSRYNVQIEWENGAITYEPLSVIAADDPVTCAIYARDKGLLDEVGWKQLKWIAKRKLTRTGGVLLARDETSEEIDASAYPVLRRQAQSTPANEGEATRDGPNEEGEDDSTEPANTDRLLGFVTGDTDDAAVRIENEEDSCQIGGVTSNASKPSASNTPFLQQYTPENGRKQQAARFMLLVCGMILSLFLVACVVQVAMERSDYLSSLHRSVCYEVRRGLHYERGGTSFNNTCLDITCSDGGITHFKNKCLDIACSDGGICTEEEHLSHVFAVQELLSFVSRFLDTINHEFEDEISVFHAHRGEGSIHLTFRLSKAFIKTHSVAVPWCCHLEFWWQSITGDIARLMAFAFVPVPH